MRFLAVSIYVAAVVAALAFFLPDALASSTAVASAYSRHSSGTHNGCDGSTLHDRDLTVATFLVPCGARLRVCYRRRCVVVTRKDSGPFVRGRSLDLNLGVVRALGFPTERAWGVRRVSWSRVQ
jgi:rare lipoprotein A (peptidoglycan hydrolase)